MLEVKVSLIQITFAWSRTISGNIEILGEKMGNASGINQCLQVSALGSVIIPSRHVSCGGGLTRLGV